MVAAPPQLRYLNDLGFQSVCCMVADASGNVYVAGTTAVSTVSLGVLAYKVIVAKLDRSNSVIYRYVFGGSGADTAKALAADSNGSLIIAGTTSSIDFPLVNPVINSRPAANQGTGFITKLDPTGSRLLFSTFLGGGPSDLSTEIDAIALDNAGNVYTTGATRATHFPLTPNAYRSDPPVEELLSSVFAFITKLTNNGDRILYSTYLGDNNAICYGGSSCESASGITQGFAIAVGNDGAMTVAGSTTADKFPVTTGAFQTVCKCTYQNSTGFVTRFSEDGTSLEWSTFLGGSGIEFAGDGAGALALTKGGGVVVAGTASSPDFPVTPGAFQTSQHAILQGFGIPQNIFISRLNSTGSSLEFSTLLGGSVAESLYALQLDAHENPWVTGNTISRDFPLLPRSIALGTAFVAELASDGSRLLAEQMLPNGAAGQALAVDQSGNETLLGSAGSLIRIPAGGPTGLSVLGQVNAAAYVVSGVVAPGEIVSLYGTGLGPTSGAGARFDSTGKIATTIAGTRLTFDGIPAPLLYVGANQINAIVPFEISRRASTTLQVVSGFATSPSVTLTVVPSDPAIFSVLSPAPAPPTLPYAHAAALNQDGTINSPGNPARPGSIVVFYVNGAGLFTRSFADGSIVQPPLPEPVLPVSVLFDHGSQRVEVLYAGAAPTLVAGVLQINVRLPKDLPATYHLIQVQVGNSISDAVVVFAGLS